MSPTRSISQLKQSKEEKTRVPPATSVAQTKSQKKKRLSTAPQTHRGPLSLAELCSQRSRLTKSRKELQDRATAAFPSSAGRSNGNGNGSLSDLDRQNRVRFIEVRGAGCRSDAG